MTKAFYKLHYFHQQKNSLLFIQYGVFFIPDYLGGQHFISYQDFYTSQVENLHNKTNLEALNQKQPFFTVFFRFSL